MVDFSKYVKKIVPEEPVDPQPVDLAATVNPVNPEDEPQDFSKYVEGPDVPLDKTVYHTVARTSTPAGEAEMQQIEAKTGIPQDVIRANMDASRTRAEYSTLVLDAQGSPKLLGFLQDPKQLAAVRGDVPALSQVEATLAHEIKTNIIETFEDVPAGFKRGQEVVEAGQLYSELSNLIATGGDQTEVRERIAVFEEKEKAAASEGGFLEAAAEMLPIMGHTILAGQAEGLKYATVGAAGSLITGGVTAPAAAAIMYPAGVVVGAMEQMFSIERGNALKEFMDLKDETGAPMDPQVANMAAIGVGAINAGLEYVGLKNIPGADKLLGKFTKDAVKKALKDPSVRRALTKVALRYGKGIAVETITEASQEIINILGGAVAKKVSDQEFAPEDIFSPENLSRVLEAGEMAFKATTVLGVPGSGVSAVREVRKTEKMIQDQQAFVEHHTAVDEAVQATDTALGNPVMMERFLKDTMGLKDQDAFIDSDVLLELEQNTPEILDEIIQEMGASKDKILEAAEQGRPVRLNMGAYHARLSPEAKTALFNGLKSTPGSYSAAQIEAGMAQAADNFEDSYEGFITENEAINTEIIRIESESIAAGADNRVAAQTAQIAARMAMSVAENTVDGNAAELLRKIQFGPMDVQGEEASYDQSGQLIQDENFQRFMEGSQLTEPVFHGTEAQVGDSFVFDASKIGEQGRSEGAGFYFTPDKGIAIGYAGERGTVIEAYVSMKQPMPYAQAGFDQGTMEQILARAAELESVQDEMDIEDGFLSNFGDARYEGLDSVITSAAAMMDEDKALDQMGGLIGSGVDPIVVNQAVNDVTGFDGVISDGFSDQGGSQIITVFFPNQIKSAQNYGAFDTTRNDIYQQLDQGAKGNVQIFDDRYLINLFENANESTPFHELAHTFLFEMQTIIDRGAASDQMIADMTVVGSWMDTLNDPDLFQEQYKKYTPKEFEGRALLDLNTLERAQALGIMKHEYFARGFEQYLMEGKAPAPELIPAFRRFARWLKVVYKHVSQLDVKLTAPIRGVFSRMLQSEFEIEGSMNDMGLQALTKKEMDALGILPEDRDYLKRLHQDAQTAAELKLTAARVGGVRRLRPEWIEKADDSIQRDPLNATVNRLQKGQGIDRKVAVELWTKAAIDRMPVGLKKIFKVGGMNPDEVAYEEGYASAENLLDALETWVAESMQKRRYVAQRQKEYQDSLSPDDFLVDTAEFAEYLGIIGNYTAGKMGDQAQLDIKLQGAKGSRTVLARSAFKKYAKTIIRDMPIRDAIRSDLFTGAMKKASQGEAAAIKRGDWGTAQRANEQMRLNFEMAQESRKIRLEKEKIERMAKRLKKAKPDKVEASYLGAALSLAQRFGLVQLNDAFIPILQKAGDIKSLMTDKADIMGPDEFGFSTELMSGTVPFDYRDLNADELNEVAVLIKALVKRGRDKINPKLTSLGITLDEAKENVLPAIGSLKSKTKWAKRGKSFFGVDPRAWLRSITDFSRRIYADTYHLWAMIRVLDGFVYYDKGNKRGPLETYMRDNLEKAYGTKTTLTAKFEPKVKAAIAKLYNRAGNRKKMAVWLTDIIPVPVPRTLVNDGRGWDFEAVAAVALNIGNESNLSRLRDGYGWTDEQINSIVALLTEEEWDAVQALWDIFEEMRPGMYAAAERIHGVEPPTIEHRAFRTPAGKVMRGGYAPAVYDFSSVRAAELNENQLLRQTADAGHQRPSVNARATKSRATTAGGMPIRLDLSGIAQQFDYNLHYTAFAETVRDISRLLGDQEVADAIREKVGREWLPAMRIILANVANPGVNGTTDTISNLFKWFGVQASKFVLGLNRGVGVKQVFSVPAIYTEGGSWFGGLPKVLTNPRKAYNDMLEESPLMKLRMDGSQIDREVSRMRRDLSKQNKLSAQAWEVVDEALFIFIRLFDGIAVLPGYYGTKKRMERKFGPGQRAIRETEKILTDTQPISRQMDMSRVQLNRTGLARLVTMFTGFTMKFENRNRVYVRGFLEGKISFRRFATQVVLERLMPPLLMNLLFTMGYGDEPDAEAMLWDAVLYQVCGFPILRELAVGVSNAVRHGYDGEFRGFSPIGTPLLAVGEAIYFNMNTVSRWLFGDATDKEGGMALLEGLLALKGVPAVKAYKDIEEGIRQMERSDGFDAFFKAAIKPNPKERE